MDGWMDGWMEGWKFNDLFVHFCCLTKVTNVGRGGGFHHIVLQ